MMAKPRIIFFSPVVHTLAAYQQLSSVTSTEVVASKRREEFFEDVQGKYSDVLVIYCTSASGSVAGRFDQEFVERLPSSLKFICLNGAGYDQIDVKACVDRGITVTYAPDPVTDVTADLCMFLMIGTLRQLNPSFQSLHKGNFKKGLGFGHYPQGKTLGILGMGRIGHAVKKRIEPLGLKVIYHNCTPLPELLAAGTRRVFFEELLKQSDIISVHIPFKPATHHLIGAGELAKMKPSVVIVNTARGQIIDEAAMAAALDAGKIAGVGLDVYEFEPEVHPALLANEKALLVPHLGTHTTETLEKMETLAMENARRAVLGLELLAVIPEHLPGSEHSITGT